MGKYDAAKSLQHALGGALVEVPFSLKPDLSCTVARGSPRIGHVALSMVRQFRHHAPHVDEHWLSRAAVSRPSLVIG